MVSFLWHFIGKRCSMHVRISFVQLRSPLLCLGETCKSNRRMDLVSIFLKLDALTDSHPSFSMIIYVVFCLLHLFVSIGTDLIELRDMWTHCLRASYLNSLRQDIYDLAKPELETAHRLIITSRMVRVYDCLLPSPKRT